MLLQNSFRFQASNIINDKVQFLKTLNSFPFFVTIGFDLDNQKLLLLLADLSFSFFNISFANNIDPKKLYSFSSF